MKGDKFMTRCIRFILVTLFPLEWSLQLALWTKLPSTRILDLPTHGYKYKAN